LFTSSHISATSVLVNAFHVPLRCYSLTC